ncbi:MAG TPA: DUF4288 domain-containing protein [Humisphaera sp.]
MAKSRGPRGPRIINRGDWFVAVLIERFDLRGADARNDRRLSRTWENVVLFNARSIAAAYDKAVAFGKLGTGDRTIHDERGRRYRNVFVGVAALLPVYEDLEDESEVMWTDHGDITVARSKRMVRTRRELLGSAAAKAKVRSKGTKGRQRRPSVPATSPSV